MKKKGFTLVELLVVIAIIALLMGILMPALAKVKAMAYRMICGTHLSGIGKGMAVYAAENGEKYPVAKHGLRPDGTARWLGPGGPNIAMWNGPDMRSAYTPQNNVTLSASLYLLVKYAEVQPSVFNCKGDAQSEIFSLNLMPGATVRELTDAWDFGTPPIAGPGKCNSYSYHNPYGSPDRALTATNNGNSPLCADRNPGLDKNAEVYLENDQDDLQDPDWVNEGGSYRYVDPDQTGNAATHEREGQNVLFIDGHVTFHRTPNCGISLDHIYKNWAGMTDSSITEERRQGAGPSRGSWGGGPASFKDACLVNERQP